MWFLQIFWHLYTSVGLLVILNFVAFPEFLKQTWSYKNRAVHDCIKGLFDPGWLNLYFSACLCFPFPLAEEFPTYGFNCEFGWGSHKTFCHWEHDSQVQLKWSVLTSKTGPIQDHTGTGRALGSRDWQTLFAPGTVSLGKVSGACES